MEARKDNGGNKLGALLSLMGMNTGSAGKGVREVGVGAKGIERYVVTAVDVEGK